MQFDPTITLGSMLHLIVLCGVLYVLHHIGTKRLSRMEKKEDEIMKAHKLDPTKCD
jgi:hypothetical protein